MYIILNKTISFVKLVKTIRKIFDIKIYFFFKLVGVVSNYYLFFLS